MAKSVIEHVVQVTAIGGVVILEVPCRGGLKTCLGVEKSSITDFMVNED